MFSSSSFSHLQPSISWLPLWPFPLLLSLLSKPHAQPDVTLPLLPVGSGAAAPPYASTASLAIAFQAHWHHFEKCQRGWGKI